MDARLPPAPEGALSAVSGGASTPSERKPASFCQKEIKVASQPEASRYLRAEAASKAAKVKTLRFRLYRGGGMGSENSNFDILRCWQKLSPGTLEKAEMIYTPKEVPALKALVSDWPSKQAENKITTLSVNGLPCDFIPAHCLGSLSVAPFSIAGSTNFKEIANPRISLRAKTCLSLQPLHWLGDNAIISSTPDSADSVPLVVPKDNHLPVEESDLLSSGQAYSFLDRHMTSEPGKTALIKTLISQSEAENIQIGIIYGLLGAARRGLDTPGLIQDYFDAILSGENHKPVAIYVANDVDEWIRTKTEHHYAGKDIQFIHDFSSHSEAFINNIHSYSLSVIWGGRIPKPIFEKMVWLSHLPVMMEGSNTAELCQSLGKPYLPVGMGSHPFSAAHSMVEKNGYLSALLLGFNSYHPENSIKKMESFSQNAGAPTWQQLISLMVNDEPDKNDSELPTISLVKDYTGDDRLRLFFSLCKIKDLMTFGDSNVNTHLFDLIPAFLAGQEVSGLTELPTHTRDERFRLVKTLIQSEQLGNFIYYLKQQSKVMLKEFIRQCTDKDSTVSIHCQKLKTHAHAPENNSLVKALNQIPPEYIA